MRRVLRTLVENLSTRSGLTRWGRYRSGDDVAIVAYHNVIPGAEGGRGDTSLHLPLDRFIRQIETLSRTHEIVDLRYIGEKSGPHPPGPRAVITFDDAYRGAVTLALPELARRGIPAVVFAAPGLLGSGSTWWDDLAEMGRLTEDNRTRALVDLAGLGPAVRHSFMADAEPPRLPDDYAIAGRDELEQHVGGGIAVGCHAWLHEHLPSLDGDTLDRSLRRSLEWVREWGDDGCPWLALPYGAGSPELGQHTLSLGYDGVLRISGGLWRPDGTRALVPRINVPAGLTPRGLELRASGLR